MAAILLEMLPEIKEFLHNYQFLLRVKTRGHGLFSIWLSFHFCWRKRWIFEQKFQLFTSFMMRMGYKLARASVQGRVVLTRKMFLGRPAGGRWRRQSHTGSRLLLPACLAGAQATALHCTLGESSMKSSKTGGFQPRRGGLPLHWAPPLLQFQHKDYDYILRTIFSSKKKRKKKIYELYS